LAPESIRIRILHLLSVNRFFSIAGADTRLAVIKCQKIAGTNFNIQQPVQMT
jgi:hypothetical protein